MYLVLFSLAKIVFVQCSLSHHQRQFTCGIQTRASSPSLHICWRNNNVITMSFKHFKTLSATVCAEYISTLLCSDSLTAPESASEHKLYRLFLPLLLLIIIYLFIHYLGQGWGRSIAYPRKTVSKAGELYPEWDASPSQSKPCRL